MNAMHSSVDPSVSLFISQIRKTRYENRESQALYELKKLAARDTKDDESERHALWKKLYLLNTGMDISILDFVKATASSNIEVKKLGYLGLLMKDSQEYLILLQNTLQKDLLDQNHVNDTLIFMSNEPDDEHTNKELIMKMKTPGESTREYLKYLIARSKYECTLHFSLISLSEPCLYVKIQIVLNQRLENRISEREAKWLLSRAASLKCQFTKLKMLQLFHRMYLASRLPIDDCIVQLLKSLLVHPSAKAKKQIEIALALESMKLLVAIGHTLERIEEFIFRLINSKNANSEFLGFKYAAMLKIMPEIVITRIFEVGIDKRLYFDSLNSLIDKTNFRRVFQRLNELRRANVSGRMDILRREQLLGLLLMRLCEFGDQEFICKVVYENPKLYEKIRHRHLISKEQCKEFFKMIVQSRSPEHFLMIYDLFPAKPRSKEMVAEIGANHMLALVRAKVENLKCILGGLIDFLCMHGDPCLNRGRLVDVLRQEESVDHSADLYFKEIEAFNLVLSERMLYIGSKEFLEYSIQNGKIKISYPKHIDSVKLKTLNCPDEDESNVENNQVVRVYNIGNHRSIEIEVENRGVGTSRRILVSK
ncbi:uncharacterized protein VICG_00209 [Vittaforma corneae ATCC 50505]|uniref:Clathrin/coatomer adaptor adaptin-like N-terminal domain-containing protein n=1 Tax=Vittaforma corneae (strain ATCC 50505) TaxID=993615 RepID=L2GQI8_VITCO|nr:uncharacterized protein VICG_00209 [Vittaforma corneae ATCC 50505]ELA42894.1 hypothetical protein VICG_00209 [Vittaforma corneae ATCC 50505]